MENVRNDAHDLREMVSGGTAQAEMIQDYRGIPETDAWDELIVIDADLDLPPGWDAVELLNGLDPWSDGGWMHYRDVSASEVRRGEEYRAQVAAHMAPRLAERLAQRRGVVAPNAATMQGRARRWLASLPGARIDTDDAIWALQDDAITLARALVAELGDATLLAGKYGDWVELCWHSCHHEKFVLDSQGVWHIEGFYHPEDYPSHYDVDIDTASEALDYIKTIAHTDYAARMLALIIHGDEAVAAWELAVDFADPDSLDFDADVHKMN